MNMNAMIQITDIDYEETFRNLYPYLLKQVGKQEKLEILYRLLDKMGEDALILVSGFLEGFSVKEKNRLFAVAVNSNSDELAKQIDKYLQKHELGQAFELEGISVRRKGDGLVLFLENIGADVKELMKNDKVKEKIAESSTKKLGGVFGEMAGKAVMAGMNAGIVQRRLEKKAFELLGKEQNKQKIVDMIQHVMDKKGIALTLSEVHLELQKDSGDDSEISEDVSADMTEFMQGGDDAEEFSELEPAETEISEEMVEFLQAEQPVSVPDGCRCCTFLCQCSHIGCPDQAVR
ncbi:MAG: hypothetical protein IJ733_15960, partial [Lachnospiraceae bacterium]|nr:hypothetical protein [Lachnospiraceae bacterium]